MRKTSIVKVGPSLELCSCSRKLCESWLQKLFNKNNYPLVQFHCIIKIMCQLLVLGWLDFLFGVCSRKNRNFCCSNWIYIFLLGRQTLLILSVLYFYTNFLFLLTLAEFFKYQKYGECSDYYRLFCFRQILFLCIVCLFWWNYLFISVDWAMEKLY